MAAAVKGNDGMDTNAHLDNILWLTKTIVHLCVLLCRTKFRAQKSVHSVRSLCCVQPLWWRLAFWPLYSNCSANFSPTRSGRRIN